MLYMSNSEICLCHVDVLNNSDLNTVRPMNKQGRKISFVNTPILI